jgi:hypothetical protein
VEAPSADKSVLPGIDMYPFMRIRSVSLLFLLVLPLRVARAQGTVPTFQYAAGQGSYTLAGRDPARGGSTSIPIVLVPITLAFEAKKKAGQPFVMDAAPDVARVLRSPVFSNFAFPTGGTTQYADAMLRTTFPKAEGWHTLLGKPEVKAFRVTIPAGYGYTLTSKKSGRSFAVVDIDFLQKELFKRIPKQDGKLVIAVTHNTTFYATGDATVCCTWGTHGVDAATGRPGRAAAHAAARGVLQGSLARFAVRPRGARAQRQGSGQYLPRLDASGFTARWRPGPMRRHGRGVHVFPAGTHEYESQEQHPRLEGLRRASGRSSVPPAECRPAALVYRRIRRSWRHV